MTFPGMGSRKHACLCLQAILEGTRVKPGAIAAFVELHIEQGPLLEREGIQLGIVSAHRGARCPARVLLGGRRPCRRSAHAGQACARTSALTRHEAVDAVAERFWRVFEPHTGATSLCQMAYFTQSRYE